MAKGPYIFDAEAKEFRRRGRTGHWEGEQDPAKPEGTPAETKIKAPTDAERGPAPTLGIEKPEGYVDPTPIRRRRKSKSAEGSPTPIRPPGKAYRWKGMMWGLILILSLLWIYMLYTRTRDSSTQIENEKFFHLDRSDVIPE